MYPEGFLHGDRATENKHKAAALGFQASLQVVAFQILLRLRNGRGPSGVQAFFFGMQDACDAPAVPSVDRISALFARLGIENEELLYSVVCRVTEHGALSIWSDSAVAATHFVECGLHATQHCVGSPGGLLGGRLSEFPIGHRSNIPRGLGFAISLGTS